MTTSFFYIHSSTDLKYHGSFRDFRLASSSYHCFSINFITALAQSHRYLLHRYWLFYPGQWRYLSGKLIPLMCILLRRLMFIVSAINSKFFFSRELSAASAAESFSSLYRFTWRSCILARITTATLSICWLHNLVSAYFHNISSVSTADGA